MVGSINVDSSIVGRDGVFPFFLLDRSIPCIFHFVNPCSNRGQLLQLLLQQRSTDVWNGDGPRGCGDGGLGTKLQAFFASCNRKGDVFDSLQGSRLPDVAFVPRRCSTDTALRLCKGLVGNPKCQICLREVAVDQVSDAALWGQFARVGPERNGLHVLFLLICSCACIFDLLCRQVSVESKACARWLDINLTDPLQLCCWCEWFLRLALHAQQLGSIFRFELWCSALCIITLCRCTGSLRGGILFVLIEKLLLADAVLVSLRRRVKECLPLTRMAPPLVQEHCCTECFT
mmetsp:Transcript_80323/g.141661  ORF Transcript_80323/g.141661 Transcript_80323/m.141661 type:complete len:289 (-) Transcript_80323:302-1168(-)